MNNPDKTERIFPISGWDYFTGMTRDGGQVLMGLLCPELVAFFFSKDGSLLRREIRAWNYPAPATNNIYQIYDKEFEKNLELQFAEWKNEIGFQPATIKVKAFFDDEYPVGIEEVPEHLKAEHESYSPFIQWLHTAGAIPAVAVEKGFWSEETPEEQQEREQDLKDWIESGSFVFWWAKDYYMSKDGEVEST